MADRPRILIAIWDRTDGDGLYPDALLDVSIARIVRLLVVQDVLAAESVDEGSATYGWAAMSAQCAQSTRVEVHTSA